MIKKLYKSLDSTNIKAQEILKTGKIKPPFWVQSQDQNRGRGLGNNTWESEAGKNITASMVIAPAVKASNQFEVSVAVSLAICDLLNLYFDDVKIKWPNDILVNEKKIAGLLIENSIVGDAISNSIIGIGLNVNQEFFSPDIPNPVSFRMVYGKKFNIEELVVLLLQFLESRLVPDKLRQFGTNRDIYLNKLFRYKVFSPFKSEGKWFKARIVDIDEFGQLILETEEGETRQFGYKEVEFID